MKYCVSGDEEHCQYIQLFVSLCTVHELSDLEGGASCGYLVQMYNTACLTARAGTSAFHCSDTEAAACATLHMSMQAAPMIQMINIFNDAISKIVNWVIWTSPVGIASLIATSICKVGPTSV